MIKKMIKKKWPEAHIVAMLDYFDSGKTAETVAYFMNRKFGSAYTRNAIIGMKNRLKQDGYLR